MKRIFCLGLTLWLGGWPIESTAFAPLRGDFVATQKCAAYAQIRHKDNPGKVHLQPGRRYTALGLNRPDGDFVQLVLLDASPPQRWAEVSCGRLTAITTPIVAHPPPPPPVTVVSPPHRVDGSAPPPPPVRSPAVRANPPATAPHARIKPTPRAESDRTLPPSTPSTAALNPTHAAYRLVISWHPAFCETHRTKRECRPQNATRFADTHFTLHGLWPEPPSRVYCGVPAKLRQIDKQLRWKALPALELSSTTYKQLAMAMPGTQSALERHEWTKHGSCDGRNAEEYFQTALHLLKQINQSEVRSVILNRIGRWISLAEIDNAFRTTFGPTAQGKVALICTGTRLTELHIAIRRPTVESRLSDALADGTSPRGTCTSGYVDPVGFRH